MGSPEDLIGAVLHGLDPEPREGLVLCIGHRGTLLRTLHLDFPPADDGPKGERAAWTDRLRGVLPDLSAWDLADQDLAGQHPVGHPLADSTARKADGTGPTEPDPSLEPSLYALAFTARTRASHHDSSRFPGPGFLCGDAVMEALTLVGGIAWQQGYSVQDLLVADVAHDRWGSLLGGDAEDGEDGETSESSVRLLRAPEGALSEGVEPGGSPWGEDQCGWFVRRGGTFGDVRASTAALELAYLVPMAPDGASSGRRGGPGAARPGLFPEDLDELPVDTSHREVLRSVLARTRGDRAFGASAGLSSLVEATDRLVSPGSGAPVPAHGDPEADAATVRAFSVRDLVTVSKHMKGLAGPALLICTAALGPAAAREFLEGLGRADAAASTKVSPCREGTDLLLGHRREPVDFGRLRFLWLALLAIRDLGSEESGPPARELQALIAWFFGQNSVCDRLCSEANLVRDLQSLPEEELDAGGASADEGRPAGGGSGVGELLHAARARHPLPLWLLGPAGPWGHE